VSAARHGRLGLLFDLDGTLVDSDHLHVAAYAALLAERGQALSVADYRTHIMGNANDAIMAHFFPGEDAHHSAITDRKEAMFRASLAVRVEPVAGIRTLLDWAETEGAGVAVVTNAPRENAEAMLAASGLAARFDVLIIGNECQRPKPDTAPYQAAMAALGVTPSRAIAFEDSRSGLRAARDSGARVFGLTTGLTAGELLQAGAHAAIADYTDPALWAHLESRKASTA
jgi:HAD superfamily hydrolase (TIGR01509 family)